MLAWEWMAERHHNGTECLWTATSATQLPPCHIAHIRRSGATNMYLRSKTPFATIPRVYRSFADT